VTDAADNDGTKPFKFRIPPWMALLFFGPIVLGIVMYYAATRSLNGIPLPQSATLPAGVMSLPDGARANFGGKWSLLYVGRGDCDEACKEALSRTRQLRDGLGKEMSRVQRFFISTSGAPNGAFLAADHPGLLVLTDGLAARDAVLATLGEFAEGDVFIADPLGNVVLRFPAGAVLTDMQQDLALLLQASQNG
jgi:hypothetical protein